MHVDDALIFAALPMQLDIAKLLDIRTVYNHVDEGQEGKLVSEALEQITCVQPNRLLRKTFMNFRDELTPTVSLFPKQSGSPPEKVTPLM